MSLEVHVQAEHYCLSTLTKCYCSHTKQCHLIRKTHVINTFNGTFYLFYDVVLYIYSRNKKLCCCVLFLTKNNRFFSFFFLFLWQPSYRSQIFWDPFGATDTPILDFGHKDR